MASISSATNEKVFQLKSFLGLNQNPDGDTKLKLGEAADMRNFTITRDGNLQRRAGTLTLKGLAKEYALTDVASATAVFTGAAENLKLKMFPTASIADGLIVLSGDEVSVSYANAASYAGYYWRRDASHVWKLHSVTVDSDGYTWKFYRVTAVPQGSNLKVAGIWTGFVSGHEQLLAACDGKLWKLYDDTTGEFVRVALGDIDTSKNVHMFGFSGIVYMLNGSQYKQWDGTTFQDVHGYRPLVRVSVPPVGGGEKMEEINRLCGERRLWISPEGTEKPLVLLRKNIRTAD